MVLGKGTENAVCGSMNVKLTEAGPSCSGNLRALLTYAGEKTRGVQRSPEGGAGLGGLVPAAGRLWDLTLSSLFCALVMSLKCTSL